MKINHTLDSINKQMYIYSAHDINMCVFFSVMDLWDKETLPPYGAYIIFEVHNINGTYGFKVIKVNKQLVTSC